MTMSVEAVGNCTKLTIVNDQWPDDHPSYESSQESWPIILSNLKSYFETGKTLDSAGNPNNRRRRQRPDLFLSRNSVRSF
ncbi:hypothetical protein ACFPPD_01915 [Cohnella suwonensis]|uniref:Uncharacterized protein n=1 Tax=Cohnella suwonensis TaxID=696072 RepID=A0ABW0LQA9_9BACL